MKRLAIVFIVAFVGCENTEKQKKEQNSNMQLDTYTCVVMIDSCEYIYYPAGNAGWCTHKGNCNNPIHSK